MKYLNVLFICLIMFQMTACNYVKTSHIDKDFNRLLKAIKKDDESTIRQDQYQIGIPFMEDDNNWHYRIPTAAEVEQCAELLLIPSEEIALEGRSPISHG